MPTKDKKEKNKAEIISQELSPKRTALVIGASRGLGFAMVEEY
jgi:hypothetical protein